ncbi:MAG: hypothetical protein AABZ53_17165 [Planctomycetota bacterium]
MHSYKLMGIAGAACVLAGLVGACDKAASKPSGGGAGQASKDGAPNAADAYESVHAALGPALLGASGDKASSTALTERGHVAPGPAAPDLSKLLKEHAEDIDRLVEATRLGTCDFGVDYTAGLEALMPHLGKVRALGRVLKADAGRLLEAGDLDGAAKRIAAIERLAAHVLRPAHSIIELLVANAVARLGTEFVNQHPALAKAPWKTDVQQGLAELEQEISRTGGAISHDMDMTLKALREGSKMLDLRSGGGRNWAAVGQAEREEAVKKLQAIQVEVGKAWNGSGAVARLAAIEQQAVNDGVGDLMASRSRTRKALDDLLVEIKKAKTALGK